MVIKNDIQLEQLILKTLKDSAGTYISKDQVYEKITKEATISFSDFDQKFEQLKKEYEIIPSRKNNKLFAYVNSSEDTRKGILKNGYVKYGKERYVITEDSTFGAENGDTVVIRFELKRGKQIKNKDHAYVLDKVKNIAFVGEVIEESGVKSVIDYRTKLVIPNMETLANTLDKGVIGMFRFNQRYDHYEAKFIQKITTSDSPTKQIEIIAAESGYYKDFCQEIKEELEAIPDHVRDIDLKGRFDLRKLTTFTIDGKSTKDFDDAISIYKKANGNIILMVHIAAVDYYVKSGSNLDLEAYNRSFSFYPPGDVIPMLPKELSDGICSLNPNVDRLSNSVYMEFNPNGALMYSHIIPTVINSNMRMIYEEINDKYDNMELYPEYDQYMTELDLLKKITDSLQDIACNRGRLSIESDEVKFTLDENFMPTEIYTRDRGIAEKMIERAMVKTNEVVNKFYKECGIPSVNRVHPTIKTKKLEKFVELCNQQGIELNIDSKMDDKKIMQYANEVIKDHPNADILSVMLIRSLQKAKYDTNDNTFHFGLASNGYSHYTSPIRRYPDLYVHRYISEVYFYSKEANEIDELMLDRFREDNVPVEKISVKEEVKDFNLKKIDGIAESVANQANDMKDKNDEIERLSTSIYIAKHLNNFCLNEEYAGKIFAINDGDVLVKLIDKPIFGTAPLDDYIINDFKFGDKVNIKIVESDENTGDINFQLIKKK